MKTPTTLSCPAESHSRCCVITIYRAVQQEAGLHQVIWNTSERELEIVYDRELEGAPAFEQTVSQLAHHLEERSATCRDREQTRFRKGCGICLDQLRQKADAANESVDCRREDCGALEVLNDEAVDFSRGIFRIHDGSGAANDAAAGTETDAQRSPWLHRRLRLGTPSAEEVQQHHRLKSIPWEPVFVVLTLCGMIAGAVAERVLPGPAVWVFYGLAYLFGGYFGVRASIDSLQAKRVDIDLLMVLAALGAAGVGAPFEGALLLFLFSLSNVLQDFALDRTRSAIKALSRLRPDTALVVDAPDSQHGNLVPVEKISIDTLVQVKPGSRIPLDGVIVRGASSIDQSSITGESLPVEKTEGAEVLAGTINQDGEFVLRVTKTSSDSTIARVITLVEQAREQQAKTERFLDRFEQYYAWVVIGITIAAGLLPPLLLQTDWELSIYRAITLMVAASPCALIISTPASILSSIGNGARRGILFKGGVHVEQAGIIKAVAFDKTGTLTEGKPRVTDILPLQGQDESELLSAAAALESKSEHVIAQAVLAAANKRGISFSRPQQFRSESGVGVRGSVDGRELLLGSPSLLDQLPADTPQLEDVRSRVLQLQRETKTVIILVEAGNQQRILGLITLMDNLRPGVREIIRDLKDNGIEHVVMLTGDNQAAAEAIAAEAGIDTVFPELLPEHKLDAIRRIEAEYGPTAMIGDGVNDAPALAGARLGIAMGAAGTDVALETADIVLLSDDLQKIPYLIALSRQTRRTLITNISVALGLILLMVVGIYTIDLPLPLAVVGHEGGTVLVSLNGVRLLMYKRRRQASTAEGRPG
ncbi:heavy metal translocating P-type ATPase [Spirochaeta africana]|uniref:Heavy metal-translocating P-type ATPase, Cd/Co/Hg/Pb/Zn-transporting n=1 Tax=Spirochaeta africana (strain ATCC 700263 / DSM 8902 / Z-7692) TaxID=889378 RepID=H9UH25_SPIAZ|nr:heavy metal translocating P-type ATPase [Spirochaeta africana]AFG36818.1 heavy metal-translocating P-type ATPase, Cd/Co/Hg/Pb/Zn-transporting [Spirochaeta africana DSM 8902]